MNLDQILPLLQRIHGCTFASLDATTEPSPGVNIITTNQQVLLYRCGHSGYEAMVRRRLAEIGKDPLSFNVGPLPWGERLEDFPVIEYRGKTYLQCIPIRKGSSIGKIGHTFVDVETLRVSLKISHDDPSQGLPSDRQVKVRCYNLHSLDALRLMGETVS